jgi:hypothetical protein
MVNFAAADLAGLVRMVKRKPTYLNKQLSGSRGIY